jgi:hypothetical protein
MHGQQNIKNNHNAFIFRVRLGSVRHFKKNLLEVCVLEDEGSIIL